MVEIRPVYSIFIREPEGKRPRRRPRHTEDDNIKNTVNEITQHGRIQLVTYNQLNPYKPGTTTNHFLLEFSAQWESQKT
jgi:hypothetical protein